MSAGGAVVLIVEDDETARVAIAGNLRARGHEVDEAGDVREALRVIRQSGGRLLGSIAIGDNPSNRLRFRDAASPVA